MACHHPSVTTSLVSYPVLSVKVNTLGRSLGSEVSRLAGNRDDSGRRGADPAKGAGVLQHVFAMTMSTFPSTYRTFF
jgi:hypothetical protein